jgi:hypothetical protein
LILHLVDFMETEGENQLGIQARCSCSPGFNYYY